MKGDFSRIDFNPAKHYTGVLHQQGRVWLDSDWNADVLTRLALFQQELNDVVGAAGFPSPGNGFAISAPAGNILDDFQIAAGHCYVNGILCELEQTVSYLTQPDYPQPPRIAVPTDGSTLSALVYLEVWQRLVTYLEDPTLREVALGGPDTSARLKTVAQVRVQTLPSGDGAFSCAQAAQFLPVSGSGTLTTLQPANVQPLSLCQLPDPANYTGRQNQLYRVEIHNGGDIAGSSAGSAWSIALAANVASGATAITVATALTAAQSAATVRAGFVTIADNSGNSERAQVASVSSDGITVKVSALANAYTTANRASITGGVAQFKWSRDNASFGVSVTAVQADRQTVTLDSIGRDSATMLRQGDLVEVTDDTSDLGPGSGLLTYLQTDPDPDQFTVVLSDPLPASFVSDHLILRRWDGVGDVTSDATSPALNLGDGIQIQFGGQDLRTGDYWQIATRVADGSVQALNNAPPAGIQRYYTALAVVNWGPPAPTSPPSDASVVMTVSSDCRAAFPPLVDFPQASKGFHIIGLSTVDGSNNVTGLANDSKVFVSSFSGVNIQCDADVDPASLSRGTITVVADLPVQSDSKLGPIAYVPASIAGSVTATGGVISWVPSAGVQNYLSQTILNDPLEIGGMLVRLRVKGNFIWSKDDPTVFLDGEVFGLTQNGTNGISISLPSGDRRRGGDFETWFWLVAAPSFVTGIAVDQPGGVFVGTSANLIISLNAPSAPNCSLTVTFNNQNVTSTPAAVASADGTTFSVSLPVDVAATSVALPIAGATAGPVNVTAQMFQTGDNQTSTAIGSPALLSLTVSQLQLTGQLSLSPSTVIVNSAATATITITGPAPTGGQVVPVVVDSPAVATVPASVTVPAGTTTASFTIVGASVGTATIQVQLGGVTLTALFSVVNPSKNVVKDSRDTSKIIADNRPKLITADKSSIIERKNLATERLKVAVLEQASVKTNDSIALAGAVRGTNELAAEMNGTAKAFITAEERPDVEDFVLKQADRLNP